MHFENHHVICFFPSPSKCGSKTQPSNSIGNGQLKGKHLRCSILLLSMITPKKKQKKQELLSLFIMIYRKKHVFMKSLTLKRKEKMTFHFNISSPITQLLSFSSTRHPHKLIFMAREAQNEEQVLQLMLLTFCAILVRVLCPSCATVRNACSVPHAARPSCCTLALSVN